MSFTLVNLRRSKCQRDEKRRDEINPNPRQQAQLTVNPAEVPWRQLQRHMALNGSSLCLILLNTDKPALYEPINTPFIMTDRVVSMPDAVLITSTGLFVLLFVVLFVLFE